MSNTNQKQTQVAKASKKDFWLTLPQYCLPQHTLSRLMHKICRCKQPWFKNRIISTIIKQYRVDMSEAVQPDINHYQHFNAFFTRRIKTESRPVAYGSDVIVSPVDGCISQLGLIEAGRIFQAKGHDYSTLELLGGDEQLAAQFDGGQFATIYLSPRDYHRIHMPISGKLTRMRYVPGKLFSVNPLTVRGVPRLFARNERVITIFQTDFGPVAIILVGAIFVGSMETVWHEGEITPPYTKDILDWHYQDSNIRLNKGEEMGRFNMGSTVVLLLPADAPAWTEEWKAEMKIKLGQALT
ncbi:archaetidylserine decarboxylase [Methylophaga sp.]|uniref:archaetidylserine decarboxylase n=1 Tax=Methylophaga sp. TaxID=2024840 RepID=UPI0027284947|nr:archaetidylserine decarboxylase [Methylophaga sp.]MDO8826915.1 archaetidylserine decarboxylase [Methylophaga sp.]